MTEKDVMHRVEEHAEEVNLLGHDFLFVSAQGSWNYNLGYENSDVDTKAVILPKFKDFVLNKEALSTTYILSNNEHIDLKDIRAMFKNFWKQNINFLEILFSKYCVINLEYQGHKQRQSDYSKPRFPLKRNHAEHGANRRYEYKYRNAGCHR